MNSSSEETRRRLTSRRQNPFSPMPRAPQRTGVGIRPAVAGGVVGTAAAAEQQRQMQYDNVRRRFASLEASAQLSDIYQTIGHLDSRLTALPLELDALRKRYYVHAGQLEDKIAALDEKWDEIRPQLDTTLREQVHLLNGDLDQVRRAMSQLGSLGGNVSAAEAAVQGLSQKITAARNAVSGLYSGLDDQIDEVDDDMDRVDWMLDHFEAAQIELRDTEGPLAVAEAEWQEDGDEGPDGLLFLTDQRILFQQNEEIVTKKMLGIFAKETEKIEKMLLEIEVKHIDQFEDLEEKSGFLGTSRDEILSLIMSHEAPLSRARFHLLKQDSTAWANLIRRVKNGEIDEDRAEDYLTELTEAEAVAAGFPKRCPHCFADLPEPPRGVSSVVCEFCATVVNAGISTATT
jgi:hypothetical protein